MHFCSAVGTTFFSTSCCIYSHSVIFLFAFCAERFAFALLRGQKPHLNEKQQKCYCICSRIKKPAAKTTNGLNKMHKKNCSNPERRKNKNNEQIEADKKKIKFAYQ